MSNRELKKLAIRLNDQINKAKGEAGRTVSIAVELMMRDHAESLSTNLILTQEIIKLKKDFEEMKKNGVRWYPQLGKE